MKRLRRHASSLCLRWSIAAILVGGIVLVCDYGLAFHGSNWSRHHVALIYAFVSGLITTTLGLLGLLVALALRLAEPREDRE